MFYTHLFVPLHPLKRANDKMDDKQNDIAQELAQLHVLSGIDFSRKLEQICQRGEFHPVKDEVGIYSAISENDDYESLLAAARRAVYHGFKVFILPNPQGQRTADFIFVRRGIYRLYDLKTIQGKSSVLNRLLESVGQANHVLLNLATDYQATALARSIKKYFERNPSAVQVLIFRGNKVMSVTRKTLEDRKFVATFTKLYYK